jgi:Ala-tRNA(Pro) deacylase
MSIAGRVLSHLDDSGVTYEQISHPLAASSQETAEAAHVSGDCLAKGVVMQDADGDYLLAVLPASCTVHYPALEIHFGVRVRPAARDALKSVFPDCDINAIPPFGTLYGLRTAVDDALFDHDPLYFEAGDCESVVRVSAPDFRRLLIGAEFIAFSMRPHHDRL